MVRCEDLTEQDSGRSVSLLLLEEMLSVLELTASESLQYMQHFLDLTEQTRGRWCSAAPRQVLSPCLFVTLLS